jgi:hypothetical protein
MELLKPSEENKSYEIPDEETVQKVTPPVVSFELISEKQETKSSIEATVGSLQ